VPIVCASLVSRPRVSQSRVRSPRPAVAALFEMSGDRTACLRVRIGRSPNPAARSHRLAAPCARSGVPSTCARHVRAVKRQPRPARPKPGRPETLAAARRRDSGRRRSIGRRSASPRSLGRGAVRGAEPGTSARRRSDPFVVDRVSSVARALGPRARRGRGNGTGHHFGQVWRDVSRPLCVASALATCPRLAGSVTSRTWRPARFARRPPGKRR
jgi:hypothetical protein